MFQTIERGDRRRTAGGSTQLLETDTIEFADTEDALTLGSSHRVAESRPEPPAEGFRLTNGPVTLDGGDDLFGHQALTIMIDFCRELPGDSGVLVSFDGSFEIRLGGDLIEATIMTTGGNRTLIGDLGTDSGAWHRVALTFCGARGRAELFLDGERVALASGLEGAEQEGNFFAELMIGSEKGGESFPGLLDNFRFLDAALRREELPAR